MKKVAQFVLITTLLWSCKSTVSNEKAFDHFMEVYQIYNENYRTSLIWSEKSTKVMHIVLEGNIPDSLLIDEILSDIESSMNSHRSSLKKLDDVNPFFAKNDILSAAKTNIEGQLIAQQDVISLFKLLYGGVTADERDKFSVVSKSLNTNAGLISVWKDDLIAFRKEFSFTEEQKEIFRMRFDL